MIICTLNNAKYYEISDISNIHRLRRKSISVRCLEVIYNWCINDKKVSVEKKSRNRDNNEGDRMLYVKSVAEANYTHFSYKATIPTTPVERHFVEIRSYYKGLLPTVLYDYNFPLLIFLPPYDECPGSGLAPAARPWTSTPASPDLERPLPRPKDAKHHGTLFLFLKSSSIQLQTKLRHSSWAAVSDFFSA